LFTFLLVVLIHSQDEKDRELQRLKEENERLKQKPTRAQNLEVQHVDPREDLVSHILANRTKILILRNPKWVLPIESPNKKETTLCALLSKERFTHYYDCSKFSSSKVEISISFKELRKVKGCVYVNDYNVLFNEKLKKHILSMLKPFLGLLMSGGEEDLLVWLDERHKIDEEGFRTDPRDYVYDNFYLYYGSLGSGTMLHFVSLSFYSFTLLLTFTKGHARNASHQRGLELQKEVDLYRQRRAPEARRTLRDLFRDTQFVSPEKLREMGIEFEEVIVEAGQAVFVPSGVLHCVLNLEPETVAVAWNIMPAEHVLGAMEVF